MEHGPLPWKIIRSETPYYTWLMAADSTAICWGFGTSDENVLLHAARLLSLCERAADALGEGALADEMRATIAAIR